MTDENLAMLVEVDQRSKSNTHRLDTMEKRQDNLDKLVSTVATLASEQKHVISELGEVKTDVKALTGAVLANANEQKHIISDAESVSDKVDALAGKPGKRWDSFVEKILWLIVGGVIALAAAHLGINI